MVEKNDQPPKAEPTPFARFEDFTRKLVSVPKKEIDAEAKKYQQAKVRRKKGKDGCS